MSRILIFDVDGTLTGQRRLIHEDFARFFRSVVHSETVYLVSGSNLEKLATQIPVWLINSVAGLFTCSGNSLYEQGVMTYQMLHDFPEELKAYAQELVDESPYQLRTGVHLEERTGTLNVSVVGRNANALQRKEYEDYDLVNNERKRMIDAIEARFDDYEANQGGQISIDISPRGWNKSRVCMEVRRRYAEVPLCFFGDNIRDGGNDLPLAQAIRADGEENRVYTVRDHFDTWKILQDEFVPELRRAG